MNATLWDKNAEQISTISPKYLSSTQPNLNDLNPDIWREVLKYLRCDLLLADDEVLCEKQKSLYALALVEKSLTKPALDLLWESTKTLQPIVSVVNASAPHGNVLVKYNSGVTAWVGLEAYLSGVVLTSVNRNLRSLLARKWVPK